MNTTYTLQIFLDDEWRDITSWTDPREAKRNLTYYLEHWWNQPYRVITS